MKYGLIGEKLGYSFSKEIHTSFHKYDYVIKELSKSELENFIKAKEYLGLNVTIPYKTIIIPYLDEIDKMAYDLGAVNTIVNDNGKLYGYNTDVFGFIYLVQKSGCILENKNVCILGTGATSKTITYAVKTLGAKQIYNVSRNQKQGCFTYQTINEVADSIDVIINASPCGTFPNIDECLIELKNFKNLEGVLDVVYNPLKSSLVRKAEDLNIKAIGGLYMLVAQASLSAKLFLNGNVNINIDNIYKDINDKHTNIILIGMPGSGKTTIGKVLSEELEKKFIDVDSLIEEKIGVSINEFFKKHGEEEFRKVESEVIKDLSKLQGYVIATGGGVVLNEQNMYYLRANGKIILINRDLDKIIIDENRPLLKNKTDLKKIYKDRYAIYKKNCDLEIFNNDTIANAVKRIGSLI